MLKQPVIRDKKHLRFIASLPCCACGIEGYSQAAHIRSGSGAGMGRKPCDSRTLSLCCARPDVEGCHALQGRIGEEKFWEQHGGLDNAITLAAILYAMTGDEDMARFEISGTIHTN